MERFDALDHLGTLVSAAGCERQALALSEAAGQAIIG